MYKSNYKLSNQCSIKNCFLSKFNWKGSTFQATERYQCLDQYILLSLLTQFKLKLQLFISVLQ